MICVFVIERTLVDWTSNIDITFFKVKVLNMHFYQKLDET
jgi:hypothetical protein